MELVITPFNHKKKSNVSQNLNPLEYINTLNPKYIYYRISTHFKNKLHPYATLQIPNSNNYSKQKHILYLKLFST